MDFHSLFPLNISNGNIYISTVSVSFIGYVGCVGVLEGAPATLSNGDGNGNGTVTMANFSNDNECVNV